MRDRHLTYFFTTPVIEFCIIRLISEVGITLSHLSTAAQLPPGRGLLIPKTKHVPGPSYFFDNTIRYPIPCEQNVSPAVDIQALLRSTLLSHKESRDTQKDRIKCEMVRYLFHLLASTLVKIPYYRHNLFMYH